MNAVDVSQVSESLRFVSSCLTQVGQKDLTQPAARGHARNLLRLAANTLRGVAAECNVQRGKIADAYPSHRKGMKPGETAAAATPATANGTDGSAATPAATGRKRGGNK